MHFRANVCVGVKVHVCERIFGSYIEYRLLIKSSQKIVAIRHGANNVR